MPNLHTYTAAHAGGSFAPAVRLLAGAATACWTNLLAALQESREREAARVIARYRHLSEDAEQFYQREINRKRSSGVVTPLRRAPRPLHVDPMQGIR
jgi:hypothetical protein